MSIRDWARGAVATLAAGAALAAPPVAAKGPRCITRAQLTDLTHAVLPGIVDAMLTRCTRLLPPDAYFSRAAARLRADYPVVAISNPAAVRGALEQFTGETMPAGADGAVVELFVVGMRDKFGLARLTPEQCRDTSEVLEPLEGLPPAKFEQAIVAIFAVVSRKDKDVRVCEVATSPGR